MSIYTLTQAGLPGVTMRYLDGGKKQLFMWNGMEIEFGPAAQDVEIVAAFKARQAEQTQPLNG